MRKLKIRSGFFSFDNYHEFVAELVGNLAEKIDSDSEVTVKVLGVDTEKGILSLKVIEEFVHPNGKMGSIECERTVILNKLDNLEPEYYQVKFYLNKEDVTSGKPYKVFRVLSGSTVKISTEPKATDGTFVGWFDTNDYMADFSIPVERNLIYYAAWN